MVRQKLTGGGKRKAKDRRWAMIEARTDGFPQTGKAVILFGKFDGVIDTTVGYREDNVWWRWDGRRITGVNEWAFLPRNPDRGYW